MEGFVSFEVRFVFFLLFTWFIYTIYIICSHDLHTIYIICVFYLHDLHYLRYWFTLFTLFTLCIYIQSASAHSAWPSESFADGWRRFLVSLFRGVVVVTFCRSFVRRFSISRGGVEGGAAVLTFVCRVVCLHAWWCYFFAVWFENPSWIDQNGG